MTPELFEQMRDLEDRHWWFRGRRDIARNALEQLDLTDNPSILDLGCGTGGNLKMLAAFGDVQGVEVDETAIRYARDRRIAPIFSGKLPDGVPCDQNSLDLVTMFDVLEHVPEDAESLVTVYRILRPGGYLLLTVPAFRFLWGPHDIAHHHQRRYRAAMLKKALTDAGFKIQTLSYFNTWLFPAIVAVRLLRKIFPGAGSGAEVGVPPGFINDALHRLFRSERLFLTRFALPFGVSLLAIARK